MEIFQITGYKNSGKTTVASALIKALKSLGVRVASLKHHGHGGAPLGMENTDSEQHLAAGAVIAGVEGDGVFQLSQDAPWDLSSMVPFYELLDVDLLMVEGFKNEHYKKAVLIRKQEDLVLLQQLTNIQAVITSIPIDEEFYSYPVFNMEQVDLFCDWLCESLIPE